METKQRKFDVHINRKSASVLREGEDVILQGLVASMGGELGSVVFFDSHRILETFYQWLENDSDVNRIFVIGGGDGTVSTIAQEVFSKKIDIPIGILPFGTCNNISRKLKFSMDYKVAANQIKGALQTRIDISTVNGIPFILIANLDKYGIQIAEMREHIRHKQTIQALGKAFRCVSGLYLSFAREAFKVTSYKGSEIDQCDENITGKSFFVTNTALSPKPAAAKNGANSRTQRIMTNVFAMDKDSDENMVFYTFQGGIQNLFGVLRSVWNGCWHQHCSMSERKVSRLVVNLPSGKVEPTVVEIDGEPIDTFYPLEIEKHPQALRVLSM